MKAKCAAGDEGNRAEGMAQSAVASEGDQVNARPLARAWVSFATYRLSSSIPIDGLVTTDRGFFSAHRKSSANGVAQSGGGYGGVAEKAAAMIRSLRRRGLMKCLTVISFIAGLIGTIVLAISAIRIFSALFRSLDTLESLTGVEFGSGKEDEEINRNRKKGKLGTWYRSL